MLKNFWKDESGQDLVEYVLVVAVVALGAIVGLGGVRDGIISMWTHLEASIDAVATDIPAGGLPE